jgi:hypothetical protein
LSIIQRPDSSDIFDSFLRSKSISLYACFHSSVWFAIGPVTLTAAVSMAAATNTATAIILLIMLTYFCGGGKFNITEPPVAPLVLPLLELDALPLLLP